MRNWPGMDSVSPRTYRSKGNTRSGLAIERLEDRCLCATMQNSDLPCDVDASGLVTSLDALVIINKLNLANGSPPTEHVDSTEFAFFDVDGNGVVSPLDALLVINALNRNPLPPSLSVSMAPNEDPNLNGVVLNNRIDVRGQASPRSRLTVLQESGDDAPPLTIFQDIVAADGTFLLSIDLNPGPNPIRFLVRDELGRQTSALKVWNQGDIVADWNATLLNAIRDWTGLSNDPYPNRIVPSRPAIATRNLAMVHLAMFDAANAAEGRYSPYLTNLPRDNRASSMAAMSTAAHHVAIALYPDRDEVPVFDATQAAALALIPDGEEKERGIALGILVAERILAERSNDGSNQKSSYTSSGLIGRWSRTEPDVIPPELPQWVDVRAFGLDSFPDSLVPPPPGLHSEEYAAAVDEVMRLGRLDSVERTADQTEIARFWADGPGTATPPGHWNRIAAELLMTSNLDLLAKARTLALLNMALADAAIAAWRIKYQFDFWRPLHAIQRAGEDENDQTQPDSNWSPFLRTPAHPSYVSGHSTFSATAATILTQVFGASVPFASTIDPQSGLTQRPLAYELITTRKFSSFWEAAEEASRSRVFGGIHFSFDGEAGLALGRAVGEAIGSDWLKEVWI